MSRLLVVNADDYGLTPGVSQGILQAHHEGIVTATSVLANAPAFASTAPWLTEAPDLEVGLHLALVGEDPPVSDPGDIPTLVDGRGRLAASWARLLPRLLARRVDPDDIGRELRAQWDRAEAHGVQPVHVDAHQHLQAWPTVSELLVEVAVERGAVATRVPGGRGAVGRALRRLARGHATRATGHGLAHADAFVGFEGRGRMDAAAIDAALAVAAAGPASSVELGTHPGLADDPDRARYEWGYAWGDELTALTDPALPGRVEAMGFRLGTHRDLAG